MERTPSPERRSEQAPESIRQNLDGKVPISREEAVRRLLSQESLRRELAIRRRSDGRYFELVSAKHQADMDGE